MLFRRIRELLGRKQVKVLVESLAGHARVDDIFDESALGGDEGIRELVVVLRCPLLNVLSSEDDFNGTLGTHDGDLGRRPCVVHVSPEVVRAHDIVGSTVGLSSDDREFRRGSLRVSKEQLRAMSDDAPMFLRGAGEEPRYVHEGDDRDVVAVQELNEPRRLDGGVYIKHTCEFFRLVGDDTDGAAIHASEAGDDVLGKFGHHLPVGALVHNLFDDGLHVVRHVAVLRHDVVQRRELTVPGICRLLSRRGGGVGEGEVVVQHASLQQGLDVVCERAVSDPTKGGVDLGASQLLLRDLLSGHRLHHLGSGDEEL
mmetsp:Transcript_30223/g.56457  ORF Transcript_30223/g.56457 Transcript_30223/m.56457 type:complete len:313 (-) Transcript_30223:686-1624(-)